MTTIESTSQVVSQSDPRTARSVIADARTSTATPPTSSSPSSPAADLPTSLIPPPSARHGKRPSTAPRGWSRRQSGSTYRGSSRRPSSTPNHLKHTTVRPAARSPRPAPRRVLVDLTLLQPNRAQPAIDERVAVKQEPNAARPVRLRPKAIDDTSQLRATSWPHCSRASRRQASPDESIGPPRIVQPFLGARLQDQQLPSPIEDQRAGTITLNTAEMHRRAASRRRQGPRGPLWYAWTRPPPARCYISTKPHRANRQPKLRLLEGGGVVGSQRDRRFHEPTLAS